ncbi:hypothetical protein GIB67_037131, partial [Kingdonia uniflora]
MVCEFHKVSMIFLLKVSLVINFKSQLLHNLHSRPYYQPKDPQTTSIVKNGITA